MSLLALARYFGPENIYVSIIESGSWDDTKDALRELDTQLGQLGIERTIIMSDTTHEDEVNRTPGPNEAGWINTPRSPDKKELRRIPYLSKIRNTVLAPLKAQEEQKKTYSHVLWLNDVIFSVEDILRLLTTNNGTFAAACALDFSRPPAFYDTFALRDASGAKPITQTWPYFLDARSRHAMMAGRDVPVQSCWNGVVLFDSTPFYAHTAVKYAKDALTFRGIPDSLSLQHLEASESCLIHIDNPLSKDLGVWMNPHVRVGYNGAADAAIHPSFGMSPWPGKLRRVWGIWGNRLVRWMGWGKRWSEGWTVRQRVQRWVEEGERGQREERGVACLVNEMQVLIKNGWAHV